MANTSKIRKKPARLGRIVACVGLCLLAGLIAKQARHRSDISEIPVSPVDSQSEDFRLASDENPSGRVVYPYSVIPGGIRDGGELAAKIDRDPVVAAHYADFNVAKARPVTARDATPVHVAYRIDNKVFWTAKKVKLAQGERLITDGQNMARGRCGNRVSVLAQEPTTSEEPPAEVLDTPVSPAGTETAGQTLPAVLESLLESPEHTEAPLLSGSSFLSQNSLNPSILTPASQIGAHLGGAGGGGVPVFSSGGSGISGPLIFSSVTPAGQGSTIPAISITGDTHGTSASVVLPLTPPGTPGFSSTAPSMPGSGSQPGIRGGGGGGFFPVVPIPPVTPILPGPSGPGPIDGEIGEGSLPGIIPGDIDNPPPPATGPPNPDSYIPSVPEAGTLALLGAGLAVMGLIRFARKK